MMTDIGQNMLAQVTAIKEEGKPADFAKDHRHNMFQELLFSDELPEHEKSLERLWQEGQVMIAAGLETTAWSIHTPTKLYL